MVTIIPAFFILNWTANPIHYFLIIHKAPFYIDIFFLIYWHVIILYISHVTAIYFFEMKI